MSGRTPFWGMLLVSIALSALPFDAQRSRCAAQDTIAMPQPGFRVLTDIFFGTQKEPAQQTLTLFSGGVAYDKSFDDPNQITMVDPLRNRIVLLHKQLKLQASIDLKELHEFIDSARKQAETSDLAAYLQGADKIELANNMVRVGDSVLQYQTTLQQPREPQMAVQYARAADALILLNGWRSGMPPFARLSLNRVVAEQNALPQEITRTTSSSNQTEVVRCRLHPNWRLSKDDEMQVSEIGNMLTSFQVVTPPVFFATVDKNKAAAKVAGKAR